MNTIEVFSMIIKLGGGLAFFLFGMNLLSSSLEKLSTGKIEKILEKLTGNIFKSILFGALVTGIIQSSAATTVIIIGLVNAHILKFKSAIGLIMGANIGTTVTGQILRLNGLSASSNSIISLLSPTIIAPIFAVIGIFMFMALKKDKYKNIGGAFLGVGILFSGMISMESAVSPLSHYNGFITLFSTFSNPIFGVLIGAIVTAIIQSSSASVGILQAISSTGAISYSAAIPIIIGQNIGTCITPIMSSINANKNAKRIALVHLYFNIIGCILFLVGIYTLQRFVGFSFWNLPIDMGGIANFHTLFNVLVTIFFIPFTSVLEKLAFSTIKEDTDSYSNDLDILDDRLIVVPGLAIEQIKKIAIKMGEYAKSNFMDAISLFYKYDDEVVNRMNENENLIDNMDDVLNNYIMKIKDNFLNDNEIKDITSIVHLSSDFERISDHCINLLECAEKLHKNNMNFSDTTMVSFTSMLNAVDEICTMAVTAFINNDFELAQKIEPLEDVIDMLEYNIKSNYITKLNKTNYSIECGVIFLEILSNLERISDHCSNIALDIIGKNETSFELNPHEYINKIHNNKTTKYLKATNFYINKYILAKI